MHNFPKVYNVLSRLGFAPLRALPRRRALCREKTQKSAFTRYFSKMSSSMHALKQINEQNLN